MVKTIEFTLEKKSPQNAPTFFREILNGNQGIYNAAAPLGAARNFWEPFYAFTRLFVHFSAIWEYLEVPVGGFRLRFQLTTRHF